MILLRHDCIDDHTGAVSNADFEVFTKVAVLDQFVLVFFIEDMVALEYNETFYLTLVHQSSTVLSGINVLFCDTIELTITDSDGEVTHLCA